jgi:sarcosine oxidase subunit alpha
MSQPNRIKGGQTDEQHALSFRWNGRNLTGCAGDTLASALLANGIRFVGRSFKYHRPRGIFSSGSEEPNALVQLREGAAQEPNTRATTVELFDGLVATSQNHRGSLEWDLLAINDLISPLLSAGFYYKTFMWPKAFWEKLYEPVIRSAAGLGRLSRLADPDVYDHGFLHCDLLVIGAGPAGLTAARAAARAGCRVILADEDFRMGGRLNAETHAVADMPGTEWATATCAELAGMPNVRLMPRTTIYGAFDHGIYGGLERKTDHLIDSAGKPRQVLWRIMSKRALLCAGATERSIAFANNDRPGVMLAGAVRSYVNRFGVAPGQQVAVFTNNSDGLRTAADLEARGIAVSAVIDARRGDAVIDTSGRKGLRSLTLNDGRKISADCLAVSGGWSPNVNLTCHHRGRPVWDDAIMGFVPGGDLPPGLSVAGAANGTMTLGGAIAEAHDAAKMIARDLGHARRCRQGPVCQ